MFISASVYADGVMFAILEYDTLYLKAMKTSRVLSLCPKGRVPVAMSCWEAPDHLLDYPDELRSR